MSHSSKKDKSKKNKINPLEYDLKAVEHRIREERKAKQKRIKKLEKDEIIPIIRVDPNDLDSCNYDDMDVTVTEIKYTGFDNIKHPVKDPKIDIKKEDPKANELRAKDLASKAKQIKIQVGLKKGHPAESRIAGAYAFQIGSVPGMTLDLKRDVPYIFKLEANNIGAELIFTTDSHGGKGAVTLKDIQSIKTGHNGLVIFGKDAPEIFYYQDRNHQHIGGMVKLRN